MAEEEEKPPISLYYHPYSFYSQKVLLVLKAKGLSFRKQIMDLPKGEVNEPWYMNLSPKGQVPMLHHHPKNKYIPDSNAIVDYLDSNFGPPSFQVDENTPNGAKVKRFQKLLDGMRMQLLTFGLLFHPKHYENPLLPNFLQNRMRVKAVSRENEKQMRELLQKETKLKDLYDAKIEFCAQEVDDAQREELIEAEIKRTRDIMVEVEEELKTRPTDEPWLCGKEYTIADITLAVTMARLKLIGLSSVLYENEDVRLPLVCEYYYRLLNIPDFVQVCIHGTIPAPMRLFLKIMKHLPLILALVTIGIALVIAGPQIVKKVKKLQEK